MKTRIQFLSVYIRSRLKRMLSGHPPVKWHLIGLFKEIVADAW